MARQVKCPYCEQKLDKEEAHEYKKKYYHPNCFETWEQEKVHRQELISYICDLFRIDTPSGYILKQIKDYQEDYKYKLKGMELALKYFHETLGNRPQQGGGIGIIPFVYEDAKQHYMKQMKIQESLQNAETEEITVYINPENNKRKSKKIDITAI